jgi:uncharacterized protein YceH (UPF0502 family)
MGETGQPEVVVYGPADEQPVVLGEVEVRVLGCLAEKQVTTPEYYPLTLNALVNACNQTSSRDPIVNYDDPTVTLGLDRLREKRLAYVFAGADSRVLKYGHQLTERFGLSPPELAALSVLLLRGPQTAGEIRGRTGRMHEFASVAEVELALDGLAGKAPFPLAAKLPRQTGLKESRYAHLLAGPVRPPGDAAAAAAAAAEAPADRVTQLERDVAALRQEVTELRQQLADFRQQFE